MTDRNDDRAPMPKALAGQSTRRTLLKLGAVAAPAALTIKPAFAAATSIMECQIPIPNNIDSQGRVQPGPGPGIYSPPPRGYYIGEEIKTGHPDQFVTPQQFDAHLAYIRRLQRGNPGYTCFASIARV